MGLTKRLHLGPPVLTPTFPMWLTYHFSSFPSNGHPIARGDQKVEIHGMTSRETAKKMTSHPNIGMGMGQKSPTRNWTAGFSIFMYQGKPFLGFNPQPNRAG